MGWASWNNYRVNISEDIIKAQADAMVANGMMEAGYSYINIDDGYFGGRDADGAILRPLMVWWLC
ncbi:alpha-galactosidase precursor [Geofilum rubicundum JCM 15548]|uniref:Alpha-galactosidase n=1 Tax=Geofilum rubicundum JCM 15548 TaxID=1236989 RepID=A0A0E9LUU5_9BACT|nr:alpha-galactosidase precursor [Geofilum rubicundum JCM 15548]